MEECNYKDLFYDSRENIKKLLKENDTLRAENTELKKKLRTAPPKGTTVRDKDTGVMGYSLGRFDSDGWLVVQSPKDDTDYPGIPFQDWEEIEVKVK